MKLIHTRANQYYIVEYYTANNFQERVYMFGVFCNTYIRSSNRSVRELQYNYQFKDSFSLHLMSLIADNFLKKKKKNSIIALLNYHNCLYYNHTEFGLHYFASMKAWRHEEQNKLILNRICDILIWDYNFNCNIGVSFIRSNKVHIDVDNHYNKKRRIIDFANQDLISMVYEIAQRNRIEKKLTFTVIYNLLLR
jgi:hypothetical protein